MDQSNTGQSISDDQELAKVLAGVTSQSDDEQAQPQASGEEIVTAPPVGPAPLADDNTEQQSEEPAPAEASSGDAISQPSLTPEPNLSPSTPEPATPEVATPSISAPSNELDSVKQEALQELRPLVDKLNVSPEEKFDTYLLLLRSTDDKALIEPAHEAAKNIDDEARRAQALLDIIKEIDFLSQNHAA